MSLPSNVNIDAPFLQPRVSTPYTFANRIASWPPEGSLATPTSTDTEDDWSRLYEYYPHAAADFYGSGTPCIFKTGPAWPIRSGDWATIVRAARPIYDHPIQPIWLKTVWAIVDALDALQVNWNTIDPLAYANEGEADLFCDFVIVIAVQPRSLAYGAAVAVADAVNQILIVRTVYSAHEKSV